MNDFLKALLGVYSENPELPPNPLGRQVTNLGPTFDELLRQLPPEVQQMYRSVPIRVDPWMDPRVRAENQVNVDYFFGKPMPGGGAISFSPDTLTNDPEVLLRTMMHEGVHELQERRSDLVSAPRFGSSVKQQEKEAYDRAFEFSDNRRARKQTRAAILRK